MRDSARLEPLVAGAFALVNAGFGVCGKAQFRAFQAAPTKDFTHSRVAARWRKLSKDRTVWSERVAIRRCCLSLPQALGAVAVLETAIIGMLWGILPRLKCGGRWAICRPDFNPVGKTRWRLKAKRRKAGERTVGGLRDLIGKLFAIFHSQTNAPIASDHAAETRLSRKRFRRGAAAGGRSCGREPD